MNGYLSKCVILALVLLCLTGTTWAQSDFFFVENSDEVVLRYTRTPGELAGTDTTTSLTVFGSGRVNIHFPLHGKRQGDYEMTLTKAELNELVATMVNFGVMEYDALAVAAEQRAIMQATNMGYYTGDADISTIEIRLARYSPEVGLEQFDIQKQVSPLALQSQARHFDSIQSLVDLATAERQLIKLIYDNDLSPINLAE